MTVIMRIRHGVRGDRLGDGPMLIRDHLDGLRSPVDGSIHTSKAGYYRHLKETGHDIEDRVGMRAENRPDYDTSDIRDTIGQAMAGRLDPGDGRPDPTLKDINSED